MSWSRRSARAASGMLWVLTACSGGAPEQGESLSESEEAVSASESAPSMSLIERLAEGQAVFGMFSGEMTPEQGAAMAANADLDFVFYSLEEGPFDIPTMEAYIGGMAGSGHEAHPITLRIPPVGQDPATAAARIAEGIAGGATGIVVPHVQTRAQAEAAIGAVGAANWPTSPDGSLFNILIIEDREGIANAEDIVTTPGLSVAIPGPGDLRRAYEGDMEAVEAAIQRVLGLCREHDVLCGITAGVDDIEHRLAQGFKVIIVTQPEAVAVGRRAAGRSQ